MNKYGHAAGIHVNKDKTQILAINEKKQTYNNYCLVINQKQNELNVIGH